MVTHLLKSVRGESTSVHNFSRERHKVSNNFSFHNHFPQKYFLRLPDKRILMVGLPAYRKSKATRFSQIWRPTLHIILRISYAQGRVSCHPKRNNSHKGPGTS